MKVINNSININNYSSAMRKLCLCGFRLVALFYCLVAPRLRHRGRGQRRNDSRTCSIEIFDSELVVDI